MSTIDFKCAYCGSRQSWNGAGTPVCSQCGATQPAAGQAGPPLPPKRRSGIRIAVALLVIGAISAAALTYKHRKQVKPPTPAAQSTIPITAEPTVAVGMSRIVRVANPPIRIIPKGAQFTAQDLLDSANRAAPAPFDPQLLVVKTPRRMSDEQHNTVFLGEVTNTSPDQVAVAPTATLTLTKDGQNVDSAEHDFPDLPPGAHVPVFFRYDGEPKAFDTMHFVWKPTQSYKTADPRHARLAATVGAHETLRGSTIVNFTQEFRYTYVHATGRIANEGQAEAKNIRLFLVLRDGKGDITGYERQDFGQKIAAGASADFEIDAVQWGAPVATVEAVAMPTSPPGL